MNNICSICLTQGNLIKDDEKILYKGKTILAKNLSFYECESCGEQFADAELDKNNSALIRNAKKEYDGLLSSHSILKIRESFKITQHEAANFFGGGLNAFSKYERGEVSQSAAMDKLMRAAMEVDGLFDWLCEDSGIIHKEYKARYNTSTSHNSNLFDVCFNILDSTKIKEEPVTARKTLKNEGDENKVEEKSSFEEHIIFKDSSSYTTKALH